MPNKLKALAVILAFLTLTACSNNTANSPQDEVAASSSEGIADSNHDSDIQKMDNNVDALKKDLPIAVDEVTTLEKVDFDGSTVTFSYRLKVSDYSESERQEIETVMRSEHTKVVCAAEDVIEGINMGFDYKYSYYDLDDIKVASFNVTKDTCDNL